MLLGYVRVSTKDQNVVDQTKQLIESGVNEKNIFSDIGVSGKRAKRPGLDALIAKAREGDTVVVVKLDRLGRSMLHTAQLANDFQEQGIGFKSLTDGVDTGTATGRMMFGLLSSFAEYEREMIVERTHAGLRTAQAEGRIGGRKPVMNRDLAQHVEALVNAGMSATKIAQRLNVSRATAYRYLDTYEDALSIY